MAQKKQRMKGSIDRLIATRRQNRTSRIKTSARDGALSENITPTERQRKCKTGEVYSAKLNKCVSRKGQDPRFGKDRPKKAKKAQAERTKPGDFGEGPTY